MDLSQSPGCECDKTACSPSNGLACNGPGCASDGTLHTRLMGETDAASREAKSGSHPMAGVKNNGGSDSPKTEEMTQRDRETTNTRCTGHGAKESLGASSSSSNVLSQRYVLLFSFVIGFASVLLVSYSYRSTSQPSDSRVSLLLASLDRHGYSAQIHDSVQKGSYGFPDLLTDSSKRELAARLATKTTVAGDDEKESSEVVQNEPTFMIIEMNSVSKMKAADDNQFVVIFDAGSTGTRVHIYNFLLQNNGVQLVKEVYKWLKPGLSDFVKNPEEGAGTIQPLIDVALETVPQSLHRSTPLVFKATAGLRLLDASGAERLLSKVRERLSRTDFDFSAEDVNIMGGTEEGLFGWITINYLLGTLDGSATTAAAFDLGGGSTQITYRPQHLAEFANCKDLGLLQLFGHDYSLYTRSYLGQGLKAARHRTFKDAGDGTFVSNCLPVGYSGTFLYETGDYPIRGPRVESRDECWQQVGRFLQDSDMATPWDLVGNHRNHHIYLFSYFYEMLEWAKVIPDGQNEKILTVADFYQAAHKVCLSQTVDSSHPFLCQDLTLMARLLGEVYMLWDKQLHVVEEINSGEISWALGAALDAVSRLHTLE